MMLRKIRQFLSRHKLSIGITGGISLALYHSGKILVNKAKASLSPDKLIKDILEGIQEESK